MGDHAIANTHCCWEGVVGGMKNSSSLEDSSTGPMVFRHLQNHFQTAALTCLTCRDAMLREQKQGNGVHTTRETLEAKVPSTKKIG